MAEHYPNSAITSVSNSHSQRASIEAAAKAVTKAGGKIMSKGEFCPGEPYLFFTDPDGYEVEIWFELPTPVDPKR